MDDKYRIAARGDVAALKTLLERNERLDEISKKGETVLSIAVQNNHIDFVREVLRLNADPSLRNPLSDAIRMGSIEIAQILLDHGADVYQKDPSQPDPFAIALYALNFVMVELLLRCGRNVNTLLDGKVSPLHAAVRCNSVKMVRLLLDSCADINIVTVDTMAETPLHRACSYGNDAIVKCLLEYGADTTCSNKHGNWPIENAIEKEHITVIDLLCERMNLANLPVNRVLSICQTVASDPSPEKLSILEKLLTCGLNVCACAEDGRCPLVIVVRQASPYDVSLIKLVLKYGNTCRCDAFRGQVHEAVLYAIRSSHTAAIQCLLPYVTDINTAKENGDTVLHEAVKIGNQLIVHKLLKRGADPNITNKFGETPMHFVADRTVNILILLEQAGGNIYQNNINNIKPVDLILSTNAKRHLQRHLNWGHRKEFAKFLYSCGYQSMTEEKSEICNSFECAVFSMHEMCHEIVQYM